MRWTNRFPVEDKLWESACCVWINSRSRGYSKQAGHFWIPMWQGGIMLGPKRKCGQECFTKVTKFHRFPCIVFYKQYLFYPSWQATSSKSHHFGWPFSKGSTVISFDLNLLPDTGFTGHHAQLIYLSEKLLWSDLRDTCLICCRQRRNICDILAYCRLSIPRTHGATNICFVKQGECWPCYNWKILHDTLFILQSKYAPSKHGCQNVRKGLLSGNIILIYDHATAENMVICLTWELVSPWYIIDESNLYLRRKFDTI